jgi:hypothetical protein
MAAQRQSIAVAPASALNAIQLQGRGKALMQALAQVHSSAFSSLQPKCQLIHTDKFMLREVV